ncbi:hypothetical protein CL616_04715 [archaeon]|nr:hypothetical protein [archaeon]|tara:strand:- start:257 stop:1849 length:1593 start_codon:yes stop_codon:yes gene_type:complete
MTLESLTRKDKGYILRRLEPARREMALRKIFEEGSTKTPGLAKLYAANFHKIFSFRRNDYQLKILYSSYDVKSEDEFYRSPNLMELEIILEQIEINPLERQVDKLDIYDINSVLAFHNHVWYDYSIPKPGRTNQELFDLVIDSLVAHIENGYGRPIENDEYYFCQEYLDSKYVKGKKREEVLLELAKIIFSRFSETHRKRLRQIIDRGEAEDFEEIQQCANYDIPNYTFLRRLGSGADGVVYLANHDIFGDVKVKVFRGTPQDKIKEAMEKEGVTLEERIKRRIALFDMEVRDKTHLSQMYDVGKTRSPFSLGETFYLTMDYVDGGSPEFKGDDGKYGIRKDITLEVIPQIFEGILRGIKSIHSADLILKDIKLRNILVSRDHETVLVDDLETIAGIEEVKLGERLTEGTDRCAAPEVIRDIRNASQSSDLYSVGVCLLYMLTRNPTLMRGINNILDEEEYNSKLSEMMIKEHGDLDMQLIDIYGHNTKSLILSEIVGDVFKFLKTALDFNPEKRWSMDKYMKFSEELKK